MSVQSQSTQYATIVKPKLGPLERMPIEIAVTDNAGWQPIEYLISWVLDGGPNHHNYKSTIRTKGELQ